MSPAVSCKAYSSFSYTKMYDCKLTVQRNGGTKTSSLLELFTLAHEIPGVRGNTNIQETNILGIERFVPKLIHEEGRVKYCFH